MKKYNHTSTLLVAAMLILSAAIAQAGLIQTVPVGNAGNAADTTVMNDGTSGYGRVDYAYNIGQYEVTNAQYTEFLNAVDPSGTNPYSLYNSSMAQIGLNYNGGITLSSGNPNGSKYAVISGRGNMPVNWVSFWSACRFANWLNNGQGSFASTETGAYTMTASGTANNTITREANWTWAVASENEWYKAAYFDPTLNGNAGGYWLYATKSNSAPTPEAPPGTDLVDGSASYLQAVNDLSNVGAYTSKPSTSFYGTYDQAGNLWEWNDAIITRTSDYRGLRGGSFVSNPFTLASSHRFFHDPMTGNYYYGFRVVENAPEPGSITLVAGGVACLLAFAWHRRKRTG